MHAQSSDSLVPMNNLRRSGRRTVLWRATLGLHNIDYPVWVRNISAGGLAIQGDFSLTVSSGVMLDIPVHGLFRCFVIWSDQGLHGLAFQDPADTIINRFANNAVSLGLVAL